MWIGADRMFSIPMLIGCFAALAGLVRKGPPGRLGSAAMLILARIASYAGIGIVVAIGTGFRTERDSWAPGAVSGWALVVALFSVAFHGLLAQRAANFIIGLICAVMVSVIHREGEHPETTGPP